MSTELINEVKKELEVKELEAKKEKIRKMLELISGKEKSLDATIKKQEEYVTNEKDQIARLKEQLEKEDYSAVEVVCDSVSQVCPSVASNVTWPWQVNLYD